MIIPWHGTESMQKNFSESVANVHREKSNKCSLRDYASSYANASSRADVLWTHLKKHIGEKPRGGVILAMLKEIDFYEDHQLGNLLNHGIL